MSQVLAKRPAFEKLHDGEGDAVFLSEVVNGQDVGMGERGHGPSLTLEALAPLGRTGHVFGKDFQCHPSTERRILGNVDITHPATSELGDDSVMAKGCARR